MPPKKSTLNKGKKGKKNVDREDSPAPCRNVDAEEAQVSVQIAEEEPVQTEEPSDHERVPECDEAENQQMKKRGRKKFSCLILSTETEADLAEWIKSNELLYKKGLREYKDTAKKQRLWEVKAKELNLEVKLLLTWYDSMRTRFGKLTSQKSGDGQKELTERDAWILNEFSFLRNHIVRMPCRQATAIRQKLAPPDGLHSGQITEDYPPPPPSEDDVLETDGDLAAIASGIGTSTSPDRSLTSTPLEGIQQPAKKKQRMGTTGDLVAGLAQRVEESRKLAEKVDKLVTQSQTACDPRTAWGMWITSMLPAIHEDLWEDYMRQSFEQLMWFQTESMRRRQQQLPHQATSFRPIRLVRQEPRSQQQQTSQQQGHVQHQQVPQQPPPMPSTSGQVRTTDGGNASWDTAGPLPISSTPVGGQSFSTLLGETSFTSADVQGNSANLSQYLS